MPTPGDDHADEGATAPPAPGGGDEQATAAVGGEAVLEALRAEAAVRGSDLPAQPTTGQAARWLLGRYPHLARVVASLPGVVHIVDGDVDLDLQALARGLEGWEQWRLDALLGRHGDPPPMASHLTVLSAATVAQLRMVASLTWAGTRAGPVGGELAEDLDDLGREVAMEWLRVLRALID